MKKRDLVELFLRSRSIKVLISDEEVFTTLANSIIATVNHRFKYTDFKIVNGALRSPYLVEQFLKLINPVDIEDIAGYCADNVIVIDSPKMTIQAKEFAKLHYTYVYLED